MTIEEIQTRVAEISHVGTEIGGFGNAEDAHEKEDKLRDDFISYVATLEIPIAEKAKAVLATNKIRFSRWYA